MTQPRATARRTTLEKNAIEVVAMLADGKTQPVVASHFGVERSTVLHFVERHEAEIEAMSAEVASQCLGQRGLPYPVNALKNDELPVLTRCQ